jgi:hypothetical protein
MIFSAVFFGSRLEQLAMLAARHRVPATYQFREFASAGGPDELRNKRDRTHRQAGVYAGRILKGDKPADLPANSLPCCPRLIRRWRRPLNSNRRGDFIPHSHKAHRKCDLLHIRCPQNHGFVPSDLSTEFRIDALTQRKYHVPLGIPRVARQRGRLMIGQVSPSVARARVPPWSSKGGQSSLDFANWGDDSLR